MTNPRPHGPATSATSPALNQSVLLGGNSAGQGQMFLRVSLEDQISMTEKKKNIFRVLFFGKKNILHNNQMNLLCFEHFYSKQAKVCLLVDTQGI